MLNNYSDASFLIFEHRILRRLSPTGLNQSKSLKEALNIICIGTASSTCILPSHSWNGTSYDDVG